MESKWSEVLRWRFTLNTAPEKVQTNARIVLRAPTGTASSLICPPADPEAVFAYKGNELENYFYWTRCVSATNFLKKLRETAKGNKILLEEVESMICTPVSGTQVLPKPGETAHYTPMLKDQYFVARKSGSVKDQVVEIWTFVGKKKTK